MNTLSNSLFTFSKCFGQNPIYLRWYVAAQKCNYSRPTSFPDYFQNPIFRKEDQALLIEKSELSKYAAVPVKPPASYETSSVYHDPLVNKVINHVMEMGKKTLARSLVEKAFENIKRWQIERYHLASTPEDKAKIVLNPKEILHLAVVNCKPLLQLSPIKRGGITYQVCSYYQYTRYQDLLQKKGLYS
ncbi:small ribosomal subunit protein uS7m isoform X2 [Plodia interpunctella]|uniref:small ribosomal subunit protein uS7m isoform X2 n=1 Tax=Plodia interpunctella TaxID=58824 RepID=UPI002367831B|nr:28S ribosomal protein S7, mitochondrial isoform X2 [Plodia interpunctella]